MNTSLHFSSKTDMHSTPQAFFDKLNEEFHFTLDVCASHENAKCAKYFTIEDDGLKQDWGGHVCWMNPPYGRTIGLWLHQAWSAANLGFLGGNGYATVVCLLPARTDTKWFHSLVLPYAEIRWIKGRLKFGDSKNSAPFPSMLAIFHGRGTV